MNQPGFEIGVDENGLGSRLGPLLVTGVLAEVDSADLCEELLPAALARDLDDSKALVAHGRIALAEAWARVLTGEPASPMELLQHLSLESPLELQKPCPPAAWPQCWAPVGEHFEADEAMLSRVRGHRRALDELGIRVCQVRTCIRCVQWLNRELAQGRGRFAVDLHAMESLVLALRERAGAEVRAICGKVGSMGSYPKHFGPLAGRLHSVVEEGAALSRYRIPGLGTLSFMRDADASHVLVMLASLIGKYLRELLMGRVAEWHLTQLRASGALAPEQDALVSGYHDPRTARFVTLTAKSREQLGIPDDCFERAARTSKPTMPPPQPSPDLGGGSRTTALTQALHVPHRDPTPFPRSRGKGKG